MRRIFLNLDQIIPDELSSKTLTELRDIAKEMGIKSVSKYKKNELVELINENIPNEKATELNKNIIEEKLIDKN